MNKFTSILPIHKIRFSRFIIKLLLLIVPLLMIAFWFFVIKIRSTDSMEGVYYNWIPLLGTFILGVYAACYETVMIVHTYLRRFDRIETIENWLCLLLGALLFCLSVWLFMYLLG